MNINLLRRISLVLNHFAQVKGLGNTKPLLSVIEQNPDVQLLVTSRKAIDKKLHPRTVNLADLALGRGANKPTITDNHVMFELLSGAQILITQLTNEVMRLNDGIISADHYSPSYSPLMSLSRVKVNGRYIDNCVYVNMHTMEVRALKTNASGKVVLDANEQPTIVSIKAKEIHVHFTLD